MIYQKKLFFSIYNTTIYFHSLLIKTAIVHCDIGNTYILRIVLQGNGQINNIFSYKIGWSIGIQVITCKIV